MKFANLIRDDLSLNVQVENAKDTIKKANHKAHCRKLACA